MCKRLSCAVDTECSSLKQGMICGSSNDVTRGHNALGISIAAAYSTHAKRLVYLLRIAESAWP